MVDIIDIFVQSVISFAHYTWSEITFQITPWYINYFWWLILLSLVIWGLEIVFPWRKNQPIIRKDFWLDAFYMFFNFYIFKLIILIALSQITESSISYLIDRDLKTLALFDLSGLPNWIQLIVFFVVIDFVQWLTHILLHRVSFLWHFHKVHHSVEQMGFAAHLRFHWMENMIYTPVKYLAVMLIGGFGIEHLFTVYYISIAIGHLNHANIGLDYGPLKYVFNNPKMHIWHHAASFPSNHKYGVNFGISLSCWDYLFKTSHVPQDGKNIQLGFKALDAFPKTFWRQLIYPFKK